MLFVALFEAVFAAENDLPELPPLAQYGLVGLILALVVAGRWIVPKWALDRETARADRAEAEADRLRKVVEDRVIPALVESTAAQNKSADALIAAAEAGRGRGR